MTNIKKIIKNIGRITQKDRFLTIIIAFSAVFFLMTSILPNFQEKNNFLKFFSPDENANYVFTKLYAQTDNLYVFEKYNLIAEDIVRPRSYISENGFIKPVSFLGMTIYYGFLAKIFGVGIIPYLTPFFASLAKCFKASSSLVNTSDKAVIDKVLILSSSALDLRP